MKKRIMAILLALTMIMTMVCAAVFAESNAFTDVREGAFYYDAVLWALEQDITQGMGGGLFQPDGNCSRAQVVTFLWRLAGKPAASTETPFTDVPAGKWYADAVAWAVEQEITEGMGGGLFQPDGNCSRAQIVTFLWRYAGKPTADTETSFTDVPAGKWYTNAVAWAVEEGITKGITTTTFCPDQLCNRGQVVTFLYRYDLSQVELPEETAPTEPKPTEPQPTEPQPTEPQPTEPKPTEPQPTEPKPTEPQPTEPQPTEPKPTEPQPTEPQPTEPKPTEPQPTEPEPTEPAPTEPDWGMGEIEF